MSPTLPKGSWPVMLTPFLDDQSIDWHGVDALTDWYIASGSAGLFAVCLSSEMYQLTDDERTVLATRVVRHVAGRVPVVATGTFGGTVEEQARTIMRMAQTGVAAAVVSVNQLACAEEADTVWQQRAEHLLALTGELPLGLYECPNPYHRLLSPDLLGWAGATGRFVFHKDTACELEPIRAKLAAARGTPLSWFNANCQTLLASLQAGGDGYCGIAANVCPELFAWLCRHAESHPDAAQRLQRFLSLVDVAVSRKYPTSAKLFLASVGLPIGPNCRTGTATFREDELLVLDHLRGLARETFESLP